MDTAAMASWLLAVDAAQGRDSFSPPSVFKSISEFRGWNGNKMHIKWRGIMFWHTHSCKHGACIAGTSLWNNLERCPTLCVLLDLAVQGLRPRLWLTSSKSNGAETVTQGTITKPYPLQLSEQAIAREKHADFGKAGVLQSVSKRQLRSAQKQDAPASSAFVVVKWRAIKSPAAAQLRHHWARTNPEEVRRFIAGDKSVTPPHAAYTAKWRVVYDLKHLNQRTLKLPMVYGKDAEAWAKVLPGTTLAVLDVKDGFTAVPINKAQTDLFNIMTDGQTPVQLQRMPFGYRLAPFFFCLFSSVLAEAVRVALGGTADVHMYMDDALLVLQRPTEGGSITRLVSAHYDTQRVAEAKAVMAECGGNISEEKIEGPAPAVDYLGMRIHAQEDRVDLQLPEAKWFTLTQLFSLCHTVMRQPTSAGPPTLPRGAIDSLVGKIQALSHVVPLLKADLGTMYSMKRGGRMANYRPWAQRHKLDAIALSPQHCAALDRIVTQITAFTARTLYGAPTTGTWPMIFGAVDASGEGGLGGHLRVVGSRMQCTWSERLPGAQEGDEWVGLSTFLELQAVIKALEYGNALLPGQWSRMVLAVDSQAAASVTKKGYSTRCAESNSACKQIEELSWQTNTLLTVVWVPRRVNWRADVLSHPGPRHEADWEKDLPESLTQLERQLPMVGRLKTLLPSSHSTLSAVHSSPATSQGVDSTRQERVQNGCMEQGEGTGKQHKEVLLIGSQAVCREESQNLPTGPRDSDSVRVLTSLQRHLESTCDRQVHYPHSVRNEMAGNSTTRHPQSNEDVVDKAGYGAPTTITGNAAQTTNLIAQAEQDSRPDTGNAYRPTREGNSSSPLHRVLWDAAGQTADLGKAKELVMENQHTRAHDHHRQNDRQDAHSQEQGGGYPSHRRLETTGTSLDKQAGETSATEQAKGEHSVSIGTDYRSCEPGGTGFWAGQHPPRRQHVLASKGPAQRTHTQTGRMGSQLHRTRASLHVGQQAGRARDATTSPGTLEHLKPTPRGMAGM